MISIFLNYGNDCSSNMDEYLFLQEYSNLQEFQMESDAIIEDIISGITPFDREDDILIIEDFCSNLINLSNQLNFILNLITTLVLISS